MDFHRIYFNTPGEVYVLLQEKTYIMVKATR
jgi:hypothetical protein